MAEGGQPLNGVELAQKWLNATDSFAELRSYLRDQVPQTFCLDTVVDLQEDERVQQCFLHPLECFLFGEDPQEGLAKLKQQRKSSERCGHVFKEGETVYSCRDCAIDPTCVLCMDCFQASGHKGHRYKMHASLGGGFCDCGDLEAWKIDPWCSNHEQGTAAAMETDASVLEPVLRERAEQLFRCLLRYITEIILIWENNYFLPADLRIRLDEDTFVSLLYNDDHHTFGQVIYSLQRSIKCSPAVAQSYAELVDKEGRWIVKKGTYEDCKQANAFVVASSRHISQVALRIECLHYTVAAHQNLALRLCIWLQKIVSYSVGFRQIVSQVFLEEPGHRECLVFQLVSNDCTMHKGARKIVYELICCSILMDAESKRLFAIEFTKYYDTMQYSFIHEYTDSSVHVTSLSVQIFTVPTLARHLIEEAKVIQAIVDTIMRVLMKYLDSNLFNFRGYNSSNKSFRINAIFQDLRYILLSKPTEWTDSLRTEFLEGFKAFLDLLSRMQGMEPIRRQFGQHIEVEPEWEAAFSLQIQLRHILSMFQDWCASDEKVLLQAFTECHEALTICNSRPDQRKLLDFYMCQQILHTRPYKVSQESVSIHLPLSRLFAGLYLQLCRTGATERLHQHVDLASYDYMFLAEHSLRCLVLAAQVSSEMWRRNGLSLVNQVYHYQDVKCREEMYDKDVLMLQIAASNMDPNHFLMLFLVRFELFGAFGGSPSDFKDQVPPKHCIRLIEEMLFLLIVIIGERYVPGVSHVTKEDVVMREVIHLLCIEPMAHSRLVKCLPENESQETGLESVLSKVSNFRKPGVSGNGLYELKTECLTEFNPFFCHYSKSQRNKAEDSQKKRRAQQGTDQALLPPVPPAFCPAFAGVVRLLSCDIFIHILSLVLQQAVNDRSTQWIEATVQRALHLIGLALLEEKSQLEAAAEEDVTFDFSLKARGIGSEHSKSVFQLLNRVKSLPALEGHTDMFKWILQMFEMVNCLREKSSPTASVSMDTSKTEAEDKEKAERKRKADAAKLHRQRVMAQMSAMQKNFIESNKMLYDKMPGGGGSSSSSSSSSHGGQPVATASECSTSSCVLEQRERRVALGPQRGSTPACREVLICILCQEEQEVATQAQAMVLTACVQRSTVLTQCRGKTLGTENASGNAAPLNSLFMSPELLVGTHTGSCGHIMHSNCWQKYFEVIQNMTRNRLYAELILDLENGQYLCPICKSLCNTVVPLIPVEPLNLDYENAEIVGQHLTLPRWTQIISARISGLKSVGQSCESAAQEEEKEEEEIGLCGEGQPDFRSILSFGVQEPRKLSDSIAEMLVVCATTVHRVGLETTPNELCPQMPTMAWNTCAFTIQAVENVFEEDDKPLFGSAQNRQLVSLNAVIQFSAAQRLKSSQSVIQTHFIDMLAVLLPTISRENTPSILEVDFFHLLVGLVLSVPALYHEEAVELQPSAVSSAYNHLYILHLVTMAHLVQLLFTSDFPAGAAGVEGEEARAAAEIYATVSQLTTGLTPDVCGSAVAERVKVAITPFLRCAALFFNGLTGVPPPEDISSTSVTSPGHMEALCSYLALPPNLFQLFCEHRETLGPLLQRWCQDPVVTKALKGETQTVRYPRRRNHLIELPADYSSLLNQATRFRCPVSNDSERKHPTLCLVCGVMLCSQSTCCQSQADDEVVGACTAHAATCGAGVGVFLSIRECEIVLKASKTRGRTYPVPYLDDYGETDPQLLKGNPLHLCLERYKKLNQLWQQHCVLNEIARSLEVDNFTYALEWQML